MTDLEATADNAARLALELAAVRTRLVAAEAALANANADAEFFGQFIQTDCQLDSQHATTMCNCEFSHRCFWCQIDDLTAQLADANKRIEELETGGQQ